MAIKKLVLFFLLLEILLNITYGFSPQYQIIGRPIKGSYVGGEEVIIQVFMVGTGKLDSAKFSFSTPENQFIDNNAQVIFLDYRCEDFSQLINYPNVNDALGNPQNGICCHPIGRNPIKKPSSNIFSKDVPIDMFENECDTDETLSNYIYIKNETSAYSPITLQFKLRHWIESGEHPIYLSFTYFKDGEKFDSSYVVNVKVRAWYEEGYIPILAQIAVVVTILTPVFIMWEEELKNLREPIKKRFKKRKPIDGVEIY